MYVRIASLARAPKNEGCVGTNVFVPTCLLVLVRVLESVVQSELHPRGTKTDQSKDGKLNN
jgi:hypothetical protein